MTKLIVLLTLVAFAEGQRILYGLPPLPHDSADDDLLEPSTTTPTPFRFHTFPPFTFPPFNHHPTIAPFNQLRNFDINPIPELPPIPESRLDGIYDNDGNFVPRVKPEGQQVVENRIHGVKNERIGVANFFHPTPPSPLASRRAYSKARGVGVVTIAPRVEKRPLHSNEDFNGNENSHIQSGGTKNARQWQTTAVKLNDQNERIDTHGSLAPVESSDKVVKVPRDQLAFDNPPSRSDFVSEVTSDEDSSGLTTTEKSNRKEIVTTRLAVEPIGTERHVATSSDIGVTAQPSRVVHRGTKNGRVINNSKRISLNRTGATHGFFDYRPKQRTFQPEQIFVTRAPIARPRQIPNPAVAPVFAHPIGPISLPPQPFNRAPEDAAFLAEIEEYDWRLHYRQQALEAASLTPNVQARPLLQNRAHAERQQNGGNRELDADYDDLEALKIREHFTENPPQKNFNLGGAETATSVDDDPKEVLVPFNSVSRSISTSHVDQVINQPEPVFNQPNPVTQPPTLGFNPQNNNGYLGGITPHPLFNGLFNLFNLHGTPNGGGLNLFPGLGR